MEGFKKMKDVSVFVQFSENLRINRKPLENDFGLIS